MDAIVVLGLALLAGAPISSPAGARADDPPTPFGLRDGDRVVLVGDALFERDYEYGDFEATLTARLPGHSVRFRNLGRSGDTVWGDARAGFETAAEGFDRRAEAVVGLKPTLILVACGMNESFAGEAGLARFVEGLGRMLDSFEPAGARVVLVAPIVHERLAPPLPDPSAHNADLARYRDAMAEVARSRRLGLIDLHGLAIGGGRLRDAQGRPLPETENGIHLSALGHWRAAQALAHVFSPAEPWRVALSAAGPRPLDRPAGTSLEGLEATPDGLRFRAADDRLPDPAPPAGLPPELRPRDRTLIVRDLPPGRYALRIDGEPFAAAAADEWAAGVPIGDSPERRQAEELRRAVLAKNEQFFHRSRPQNETYLFGFRRHEQGNNAAEIPEFDRLVERKEAEIDRLLAPKPRTYELIREEDGR